MPLTSVLKDGSSHFSGTFNFNFISKICRRKSWIFPANLTYYLIELATGV